MVTRGQLLAAGLTRRQVEGRMRSGRLRSLHRGVYLVGAIPPPRAREMAAALACGPGALVSHRDAAALWGILAPAPNSQPVRIVVQGRDRGRRPGVRAHRVARLRDDEVGEVEGIPVTSPARTLLDLAANGDGRALERALAEAERLGLVRGEDLAMLLARYPRHRGARALRTLIEREGGPALTRSEAEDRFLGLVRKAGLSPPEVNVPVAGYEVDFLWPTAGVAVEVDGFSFHGSKQRFERDRRRDAHLLATEGIQVTRVTWQQVVDESEAVLARLCLALGRARAG